MNFYANSLIISALRVHGHAHTKIHTISGCKDTKKNPCTNTDFLCFTTCFGNFNLFLGICFD